VPKPPPARGNRGPGPDPAIEDESGRRNREAEGSREETRALDTEGGYEQERRRERAKDSAGGVCRVENAGGRRHGVGVWIQRPQQGRQRAAHQEGRQAHEAERKHPGERTHRVLERDEERRRAGERQRGEDTEGRDTGLERRVESHGARDAVGKSTEREASQGEAPEEGAERDRDGVDLHPDHPAELPHPEL